MPGVLRGHTECGEGVRDDIGRGSEIFTRSGGEVHDALDTAEHVFGLPPGHSHIVHGIRSLGGGELCGLTHLLGLGTQCIKIVSGRSGHSRHLGHGLVEVCGSLHSRSTESHNGRGYGSGQGLTHPGDFIADR